MKKTTIVCSLLLCAFLSLSFISNDEKPVAGTFISPAANVTVTLQGVSTGSGYNITFNNAGTNLQFPMPTSGSRQVSVPAGTYTVAIAPGGSGGSSHTFSGSSCGVGYSSGVSTYVYWTNVNVSCGTAQFSMN